MLKIKKLQKKYPSFLYQSFDFKLKKKAFVINFIFKMGKIVFKPSILIFGVREKELKRIKEGVLQNFVFHLGLIEILSYWKTTLSPKILLPFPLKKEQKKWWQKLIEKGMSQFFYENKISKVENFIPEFESKNFSQKIEPFKEKLNQNKILIPIGGGKDSLVTFELLKKTKKEIFCFSQNPNFKIKKIFKILKPKNQIFVKRKIDLKLLKLQSKGYLKGHIPFSANLAFLSSFLALLFDIKFLAFSNEKSSQEGNLKYQGRIINHQWSKSLEFERMFRDYSKKYLAKDLEYFSFLRPLYEIQIAKIFSNFPKYFQEFVSCNKVFRLKKPSKNWCQKCPKCLFVFLSLYPFLKEKEILKIFGKNLLSSKELLPLMEKLVDPQKPKPFECVGTKKEAALALYLSWEKIKKEKRKIPFLIEHFEKKFFKKNLKKEAKKILTNWQREHFLPKEFEKILKNEIKRIKR